MKNEIHALRQQGYKVQIQHKRRFKMLDGYLTRGEYESSPFKSEMFNSHYKDVVNAKGGMTVVKLTTPDNTELVGTAKCSDKDNYNRKLGLRMALGRAMKSSHQN